MISGYSVPMRFALLAIALIGALVASAPAGATVPPRDCGFMTVKAKRYNVKADQVRCRTARAYAQTYLRSHTRPGGYRCRDYGAETAMKFRCASGIRVFFAIKR